MTVTMLAFVGLVLAVAWAIDSHWQRGEIRAECERLKARVDKLGEEVRKVRRSRLAPIDRPIVRWWDD